MRLVLPIAYLANIIGLIRSLVLNPYLRLSYNTYTRTTAAPYFFNHVNLIYPIFFSIQISYI